MMESNIPAIIGWIVIFISIVLVGVFIAFPVLTMTVQTIFDLFKKYPRWVCLILGILLMFLVFVVLKNGG